MMKLRSNRRIHSSLAVATIGLAALFASACGASQKAGREKCASPREGMSTQQWDQWAGCVNAGEVPVVDDCRGAFMFAQSMTPAALEAATRCTLSAKVATDGAVIGTALQSVVSSDGRVEAIARGLAPHYTNATFGSSFATQLQPNGERALGFHLGKIEEPARSEVIRTAFAWGLRTLAEASLPHISDPSILARDAESLARSAEGRRDLTEVDRFALVATGRWGATEIINCKEGVHRACPSGGDVSHLRLLQHDTTSTRTSAGSSRVLEQLRNTTTDPDISSILIDWVSAPNTPNGSQILDSLRAGMAATETSEAFRMSTAQGANATLCSTESFDHPRRIQTHATETPTAPWLVFLERCASNFWTFEDVLRVYAHGRNINASPRIYTILDAKITESAQGATCGQVKALATQVATWNTNRLDTTSAVYAELFRVLPSCRNDLRADLQRIARDSSAGAEARLAAIAELARSGDRSLCSSVSGISTTVTRDGQTITLRGATLRKEEARQLCR